VKLSVDVVLSVEQLAASFAELTDDQQAQFFIEVARLAAAWGPGNFQQWLNVGRHLKECECSTDDARELVRDIAAGLATSPKDTEAERAEACADWYAETANCLLCNTAREHGKRMPHDADCPVSAWIVGRK